MTVAPGQIYRGCGDADFVFMDSMLRVTGFNMNTNAQVGRFTQEFGTFHDQIKNFDWSDIYNTYVSNGWDSIGSDHYESFLIISEFANGYFNAWDEAAENLWFKLGQEAPAFYVDDVLNSWPDSDRPLLKLADLSVDPPGYASWDRSQNAANNSATLSAPTINLDNFGNWSYSGTNGSGSDEWPKGGDGGIGETKQQILPAMYDGAVSIAKSVAGAFKMGKLVKHIDTFEKALSLKAFFRELFDLPFKYLNDVFQGDSYYRDPSEALEGVNRANENLKDGLQGGPGNVNKFLKYMKGSSSSVSEDPASGGSFKLEHEAEAGGTSGQFTFALHFGSQKIVFGATNDTFFGSKLNDVVKLGAGKDVAFGYNGDDELFGGGSGDRLFGSKGDDFLGGGGGKDTAYGDEGKDTLKGGAGKDTLKGGNGGDRLYGGEHNDKLTGGRHKDKFVFDTKLDAKTNVDTITDFEINKDRIQLDKDIFKKIGSDLGAGEFNVGSSAEDSNDYIIYHKSEGKIYYDKNADGSGGKVLFARVDKKLKLDHNDFDMV